MRVRSILIAAAVCFLLAGSAAADIDIHKKHRFDASPGDTVVVDVSFHNVEVRTQPGGSVDVTVDITVKGDGSSSAKAAQDLSPVFEDQGNRLLIRSTRSKGWSWKNVKAKGQVTVLMPPDVNLLIDSSSGEAKIIGDFGNSKVTFDASSGGLMVDGAMRELHSDLSSGSIHANVTRPLAEFTADASSGSVRLEGGAALAKVDTSSGSIDVSGLTGVGKFSASSGNIKAQWDEIPPNTTVRASASSGNVTLTFPEYTKISGLVEVSSGGIHSDFPALIRGKDELKLDGGPNAIDVHVDTSSGNIKLLSN
ncbi:MAG: DUF4097 domain-containing protein [Acidobacteria bacterium]|jgi:DUF4097 and DUF4098 domain-containing protein YvlB|nr:DUF4097 domain-containing protein [Acidobacteriota bacterium]